MRAFEYSPLAGRFVFAVFGVKPALIVTPKEREGSHRIIYRFGLEPLD
jgi:hypothetical protein